MNKQEKSGREKGLCGGERVVIVAVKASKEIPRSALVWALTRVVQPGDCVKLLVVIPAYSSSKYHSYMYRFTSINMYTIIYVCYMCLHTHDT